MIQKISKVLQLEWQLEIRQRNAFLALAVYLLASVYAIFLMLNDVYTLVSLQAFYWILIVFIAVNAVAKGFTGFGNQKLKFYYTLVGLQELILGKIIFNTLYLFCLALVSGIWFWLFFGTWPFQSPIAIAIIFLLCAGLSGVFSMMSAISSSTNNAITLITILGFPLVLPLLMVSLKTSGLDDVELSNAVLLDLILLLSLDVVILSLASILFPYLCRD